MLTGLALSEKNAWERRNYFYVQARILPCNVSIIVVYNVAVLNVSTLSAYRYATQKICLKYRLIKVHENKC